MYKNYRRRLTRLQQSGSSEWLTLGKKGIEKESLRVAPDGSIAQTPHPRSLGSALTHPYITTDYSEALLELITPPLTCVDRAHECLCEIHRFVYSKLDEELLWATSMPCVIAGEKSIPIANYGSSNVGTMKHVYRRGLAYRYGRTMQAIAGVHFNYSLPDAFWKVYQHIEENQGPETDFKSDAYFHLIRNFQRFGWIIPYLFGSSPAVCKSFFGDSAVDLAEFDSHTYYGPYATSLRMSDIGYKNNAQDNLDISYNDLDSYVRGLTRAIETPFPEYEAIGVTKNGEYLQLNANILQIENEYYSFVRPKQVANSGEKPTLALNRRGVQYVEIRALDVDLFDPVGISQNQMRFIEAFLIFCLLHDSPNIDKSEQQRIGRNQQAVACCGRDPEVRLNRDGSDQSVSDWAREIQEEIQAVSELMDQADASDNYTAAINSVLPVLENPEQTPSARMLQGMRDSEQSFYHFAMAKCEQHNQYFKQSTNTPERNQFFEAESETSLRKQAEIEAADDISFDEYLHRYFTQA